MLDIKCYSESKVFSRPDGSSEVANDKVNLRGLNKLMTICGSYWKQAIFEYWTTLQTEDDAITIS